MVLPSLEAMGVCLGGGAFLALHVCWGLRAVGGPAGGGNNQGCWRVFFSFFHRWFVLCIKNPTKQL